MNSELERAIEPIDAFVQELFSIMDWVGTGSMEAGEREEQEYRDRWTALRAQLVEDKAATLAAEARIRDLEQQLSELKNEIGN